MPPPDNDRGEGKFGAPMISRTFLTITCAGLAVFMAAELGAFSNYPWATFYAQKRTSPIVIDGDLSDWENAKGFTMDREKFFFVGQGMSSAKWGGPSDLSATFKVQWDERNLYLAIAVTDDKVTEPQGSLSKGMETGSWDDDGVEIMLDNDGCGTLKYYVGDTVRRQPK